MPRYKVTLTNAERQEMQGFVQKGGKGYRIKHAQILLKLDDIPENAEWTYDRIKDAYSAAHATIAGVAKRFVYEGVEAALGRKKHENLSQSNRRSRSADLHHCLLRTTGRPFALDYASDRR